MSQYIFTPNTLIESAKINSNFANIGNSNLSTTAGDIGGAWLDFTPSLTNISIGTGGSARNYAQYTQIGKTVHVQGEIILGTSSASVTGIITLGLPVTAATLTATGGINLPIGQVRFQDVSASVGNIGYVDISSTTTCRILTSNVASTYPIATTTSSSVPMTWAAGDLFVYSYTYEAA